MNFDEIINKFLTEDELTGGLADDHTPTSIAKKHNVSVEDILFQIAKGIKIEYEHTKDKDVAREIAMDHLVEIPDYYDRLAEMEKDAKEDNDNKIPKEEMVATDVTGTSGYDNSGIAPQDNIPYAKGDNRIPKVLFTKENKKKKINIQRRPKTGM